MIILLCLLKTISNTTPDPYQSYDEYQGFPTSYLLIRGHYKCVKQIMVFVLEDIEESSLFFSIYKFDIEIRHTGDRTTTRTCANRYYCLSIYDNLNSNWLETYCYINFKLYPPLEKEVSISTTQTKINVYDTEVNMDFEQRYFGVNMPIIATESNYLDTVFHSHSRYRFIRVEKEGRISNFLYFLEVKEQIVFPLSNRELASHYFKDVLLGEKSLFEDLSIELCFEQKQELLFVEDDFSYFYFVFHPNRKFLQISLFTGLLRLDNNTNTFSAVDNFDEVSVDSLTVVKQIEKMELGSELTIQKSVLGYLRLAANKLVVENKYLRGFCKLNKFVVEDCSTATFGKLVNEFVAHSLFAGKVKSSLEKTLEAEKTVPSKTCEEEKKIISEKEKERVDFYKAIEQKKEELNKLSIELTESKTTLTEIGREYETHDRNKREIEEKIKELKKEKIEIEVKKEEKLKMKEKLEKEKENELFQLQKKIRLANEELTTTASEIKDLQKKIGNQELYFKFLLGVIGITCLIGVNLYQKNS